METITEIFGVIGAALVILAYFMLTTRRWKGDDAVFHIVNLVGAICIVVSLTHYWNLGTFIIECFWVSISGYGLWRIWKPRKSNLT